MMWTITTFVRSYIARPKPPALEHVASANLPTRIPTIALSPPSPAPPPADQSAPQRLDGASASDATRPTAETRNGRPNLASLPNANAPAAAASGPSSASQQATRASSSAITASTTGDISTTGSAPPAPPAPRLPLAPRSNDNAASVGAPTSSDRGIAWPNPNTTNPPEFTAPRLVSPSPPPLPARTAAAEVLPADEPIRGPIPLPRQRPGIFAVAAAAASGARPPRGCSGRSAKFGNRTRLRLSPWARQRSLRPNRSVTAGQRRSPCALARSRPRQAPGRSARRERHRGSPS